MDNCWEFGKGHGFFGALRLLRMTGGNWDELSIVHCQLSIAIVYCYRIDKFSVGRYNIAMKFYL